MRKLSTDTGPEVLKHVPRPCCFVRRILNKPGTLKRVWYFDCRQSSRYQHPAKLVEKVDSPEIVTQKQKPCRFQSETHSNALRARPILDVLTISDMLRNVMRPHFQDAGIRPRPRPLKVYNLVYLRPRRDIYADKSVYSTVCTSEIKPHSITFLQTLSHAGTRDHCRSNTGSPAFSAISRGSYALLLLPL